MHFKTLATGFFCGLLLAPAMAFAADDAAKAKADAEDTARRAKEF